jgi:hypothetical protein
MGKVNMSERTHPLYRKMKNQWSFFEQSAMGGFGYVDDNSKLFTHRLEDSVGDYQDRLKRTYYLNYCDLVCRIYSDFIHKETIRRPVVKELTEFYKDVDGQGESVAAFMRRITYMLCVYGQVHTVVDMPNMSNTDLPQHFARANKVQPYATIVTPLQLRDWSTDSFGNYNWVLIEFKGFDDSNPYTVREPQNMYFLLARNYWVKYDHKGNEVDSGDNPLGYVYMTTIRNGYYSKDGLGTSMLADIAKLNQLIYNYTSNVDEMIERQTFSQLCMPATIDQETLEMDESEVDLYTLGTSQIMTYPSTSGQPPQFISPNMDNLNVIWKHTQELIQKIYEMAKLGNEGTKSKVISQTSGIAQAYRFLQMRVALSTMGKALQKFERDIVGMVADWYGEDFDTVVEYPTDFETGSFQEKLHNTFNMVSQNVSKTLNMEMLKGMVEKFEHQFSDDTLDRIFKEIERNAEGLNFAQIAETLKEMKNAQ